MGHFPWYIYISKQIKGELRELGEWTFIRWPPETKMCHATTSTRGLDWDFCRTHWMLLRCTLWQFNIAIEHGHL